MTQEQIEQKARDYYESIKGKVVLVQAILGYYKDTDDSVDYYLDPPAKVLVEETDDNDAARRWMGARHLDPIYDVKLVEPHPQASDLRSTWVYGPTFLFPSGETKPGDIVEVLGGWSPEPYPLKESCVFTKNKPSDVGKNDDVGNEVTNLAAQKNCNARRVIYGYVVELGAPSMIALQLDDGTIEVAHPENIHNELDLDDEEEDTTRCELCHDPIPAGGKQLCETCEKLVKSYLAQYEKKENK